MVREQRRLAAIVSADVAGYSRLMGRDESGTLAALKTLRREIVDPVRSKNRNGPETSLLGGVGSGS
jgi:class 3 adenylate cyclase